MSKASFLFIASKLLSSPLDILFTLLVFILSKNNEALPLQIAIITCIKPISATFAFYASSYVCKYPNRIGNYLSACYLLGALPCLLFPLMENVWFFIGSYAVFMIAARAVYPAWIEMLKCNMPQESLGKAVSQCTSLYYVVSLVLPPLVCLFLDNHESMWRYLFAAFALIQLVNGILYFIKLPNVDERSIVNSSLIAPIKDGWHLLKEKPAFTHYLLLFFVGGAGIIASHAVLPIYFKENLNLSYTQLGIAFSVCKGLAFIFTSPYWVKLSQKISLYALNCWINLFTCLFFVGVVLASSQIVWLYAAYLFYGTMLSGCEITWNLSGPIFSGQKASTFYSSLNLACIGIRGCICPFLSYLLFSYTNANIVFVTSGLICLSGIGYGLWLDKKYDQEFVSRVSI